MSMEELTHALALIRSNPTADFVGPRSDRLIGAAERALGLALPPTYRAFVRELGAGDVNAFEIYGIITDDFANSSVPDAIWATLRAREDFALPATLIIIGVTGMGEWYVLETRQRVDGDAPVGLLSPSGGLDGLRIVSPDFGSFLLAAARVKSPD